MARPDRNYQKEYRGRQQRRKPGQTASEAGGHDRPEVRERRSISAIVERPSGGVWTLLEAPSPRDVSRAGEYSTLVGRLQAGTITPNAFEARVSQWRPLETGERFLSDPLRVLSITELRRAEEAPLFQYQSGRT